MGEPMKAYALSIENAGIEKRTRKAIGVSIGVHALLILLIALHRTIVQPPPALTEITWLDPVTIPAPVPSATVTPLRMERTVRPSPAQEPEHFVRRTSEDDFAPRPQDRAATEDLLARKLVALERRTTQASIADVAAPNAMTRPMLAGVESGVSSSRGAASLTRREGTSSAPITLGRSEPRRARPAALGTIPNATVAAAKIEKTDSSARRVIDGMSLAGPVADRALVSYRKPAYPEWAKSEGVEGTLTLYFIVLPNGAVKENVLVEKTSGFEDFDRNAVEALVAWRFEPLRKGQTGEQWGSITINYRLAG